MYEFRLYVVDTTPSSKKAIASANSLFEDEFNEAYSLEVIDLLENQQLAERESVFATPTLVKVLPPPSRRILGDFSDKEKVFAGLELINAG